MLEIILCALKLNTNRDLGELGLDLLQLTDHKGAFVHQRAPCLLVRIQQFILD
jgi:hypothetical protein